MKQACSCKDWGCGLPPCDGCGEDHGGLERDGKRLCRDCWQEASWAAIEAHERENPGALEKRLAEVVQMLEGGRS